MFTFGWQSLENINQFSKVNKGFSFIFDEARPYLTLTFRDKKQNKKKTQLLCCIVYIFNEKKRSFMIINTNSNDFLFDKITQWEFFKEDTRKIAYLAKNRFPSN